MEKKASLSLWSIILGVSSLIFGMLTGIPAIICGHMSLRYCKKTDTKCTKKDLTLIIIGLCLGYLSTMVSIIFLMLYFYSGYRL